MKGRNTYGIVILNLYMYMKGRNTYGIVILKGEFVLFKCI